MINNTGYEENYHEIVPLSEKIYVSMLTDASYHSRDEHGYVRTHKTPQQLWLNVVVFHEDYDFSLQQREFAEQADYFRYIAELQKKVKEIKEIEGDTYESTGITVKV